MSHAPPSGRTKYFQTNTITPPDTMPASAPGKFVRFQKSEKSITGPNAAPNPAHANDTMVNTELFGFHAMATATRAMDSTVSLAARMDCFVSIFTLNTSCSKFCETPDAAVRSCESAVDIVHAKIPANTSPATRAAKTPFFYKRFANWITTVSDSELLSNVGIAPATDAP